MPNRNRKHYFIEKKLQTKYILLTFIFLLVYTLLFVCLLLAPYLFSMVGDTPLPEQAQAARMLLSLHNSIWPALGTVILIMSFVTIYFTHRFAGPVYRIKSVLAEVLEGHLDIDFQLRKKDDLQELAARISQLINDLRTVVQTHEQRDTALAACIAEIEQGMEKSQIDNAVGVTLIKQLEQVRDEAAATLKKYRQS
ncbi:MAG: hypothetical protein C0615_04170 [Desulfuromonas sp.]|nr:MAG: hypothetical protein C0615_04170 [Desulfuromonas sp.]